MVARDTSYPQAGPGETGWQREGFSALDTQVLWGSVADLIPADCVVSLQEISAQDGKLELLRLGGEDTGVKLGQGGRGGGRGLHTAVGAGWNLPSFCTDRQEP